MSSLLHMQHLFNFRQHILFKLCAVGVYHAALLPRKLLLGALFLKHTPTKLPTLLCDTISWKTFHQQFSPHHPVMVLYNVNIVIFLYKISISSHSQSWISFLRICSWSILMHPFIVACWSGCFFFLCSSLSHCGEFDSFGCLLCRD